MLEMETAAEIARQGIVDNRAKSLQKLEQKRLQHKAVSAYMSSWRGKTRKQLKDDGMSTEEVVEALVPCSKTKAALDPTRRPWSSGRRRC